MLFSLTAVEPKSVLLCRKQTLWRFIFLMIGNYKSFKMPFRDPAWGLGCVTGRLFLTSAENWDWKGRSEALGLCLQEAKTSVWKVKDTVKPVGYFVYTVPGRARLAGSRPTLKWPRRAPERKPSEELETESQDGGGEGLPSVLWSRKGTESHPGYQQSQRDFLNQ